MYDTIIIGAGAAGLTSGLYTARRNLKTLILSKDLGGQTAIATEIENYPGIINNPNGFELMQKFQEQAKSFGAEIKLGEVKKISSQKNIFDVETQNEKYQTKTVILAFGLSPRKLNVPGEEKLQGRGVAYCATCDGPFFKGKTVAVIGGGNSALDAADFLSGITKKVYLIHRGSEFRAESILQKKVQQAKNIEILLNSQVQEIKGSISPDGTSPESAVEAEQGEALANGEDDKVESIIISNNKDSETKKIKLDGTFIEIGYEAKTNWLKNIVKLNPKGEIITDENCQTNIPGIFAAGDVTDAPYKQIVISAGEGAKAALQAHAYIQHNEGLSETPDWGR